MPADSSGHVVAAVAAELAELGISERELAGGGLRITTTLDPRRQQQAVQAARGAPDQRAGAPRSAMVAIDPGTGGVLAYYGGDDGRGTDYARAQRLAGLDVHAVRGAGPAARRAEGGEEGRAGRGGRRRPRGRRHRDAAPTARTEVSAVDLASAYATFAADGVWRPPHLVASVSTADGRVLYRAAPRGEQRFAPQVARTVTATMLRGGRARTGWRCPAAARSRPAPAPSRPSRRPAQPDAWTAGFTPELATSVWVGTDRNAPARTRSAWREFMTEALSEPPAPERGPDRPRPGRPNPTRPRRPGRRRPRRPPRRPPRTTRRPRPATSRPARPPSAPGPAPGVEHGRRADDHRPAVTADPTDRPDPDDAADETDETDEPSATASERTTDRERPADESG